MEVARYKQDDEIIVVKKYPNGKYYNHYFYDEVHDIGMAGIAGGFDTLADAETMLLRHRPKAKKIGGMVSK